MILFRLWDNGLRALWSLELASAKNAFIRNRTLGILSGSLLLAGIIAVVMSSLSATFGSKAVPARSFTFALISLWLTFLTWYSLFEGKASLRPSEHTLFELGGLSGREMFIGLIVRVCREAAVVCLPLALLVGFSTHSIFDVFAFLTGGIALAVIQSASAVTAKIVARTGWRLGLAMIAFPASLACGMAVWHSRNLRDEVAISVACSVPPVFLAATLVALVLLTLGSDKRWIGTFESTRPRKIASNCRVLIAFPAAFATIWLPAAILARSTPSKVGLLIAVASSIFVGAALRQVEFLFTAVGVIAIFSSLVAFLQSHAASLIRYPTWSIAASPSSRTVFGTVVGTGIWYYVCATAVLIATADGRGVDADACLAILLGLLSVSVALQTRFVATWYFRRFDPGFDIVDVIIGTLCGTVAILPTFLVWSIGGLYSAIGSEMLILFLAVKVAPLVIRRRGIPLVA